MQRILRETRWKVTLITGGSQSQTLEKVEDAPNQGAAIQRAIQAFPGMQFIQVTASALDPVLPPGQSPLLPQKVLPRQMAALKPLQPLTLPGQQQQQEAATPRMLHYPYSITLPMQFARILRDTAPGAVHESNGQHRIIVESAQEMHHFLDRLRQHHDRHNAAIVINGIRSSMVR